MIIVISLPAAQPGSLHSLVRCPDEKKIIQAVCLPVMFGSKSGYLIRRHSGKARARPGGFSPRPQSGIHVNKSKGTYQTVERV